MACSCLLLPLLQCWTELHSSLSQSRVLGVLHRVLGVLHRVLMVLHRSLGVLHRVNLALLAVVDPVAQFPITFKLCVLAIG